jgi:hypothetical protein
VVVEIDIHSDVVMPYLLLDTGQGTTWLNKERYAHIAGIIAAWDTRPRCQWRNAYFGCKVQKVTIPLSLFLSFTTKATIFLLVGKENVNHGRDRESD